MANTTKPIVYLSGKMRGLEDYGRGAFNSAEDILKTLGYPVVNPARLPTELRFLDCMPICISMINASDVLVTLPGWEDSPGAKLEVTYAKYQGKETVDLNSFIKQSVTR